MEDIENVYTGKTVDEAIEAGLSALKISRDEAEIEVLEEGKKKLFGGVKAKVRVTPRASGANATVSFIDGLMEKLGIRAVAEVVSEGEKIEINITSTDSSKVIGRHGDVLDAIQCLAGAVANIGNKEYKKVIVDCEGYRAGREKTLKELAERLAKKAVEKGKKVTLEPMNPYERRIIHAALIDNAEVKTASDGREPNRRVVIIPNNARPYERDDRRKGDRGGRGGDRRPPRGDRRDDRPPRRTGGQPKGKKEIHFGAFLGNSGAKTEE